MNPTTRLRDRKRQARLTFSPVPSSSPAAAQLSASVRNRAAAVAYEGAPTAKRRRVIEEERWDDDETGKDEEGREDGVVDIGESGAIPTPMRSSQANKKEKRSVNDSGSESSDSDVVLPSHRKPPTTATQSVRTTSRSLAQGRLDFSQHIGRAKSPQIADRTRLSAKEQSDKKMFGKGRPSNVVMSSDSSCSDDEIVVIPQAPPSTRRLRSGRDNESEAESVGELPSSATAPVRRSARASAKKATVVISSDEEDDGDQEDDFAKTVELDIGEPETSGDDILVSSPAKRPRRGPAPAASTRRTNRAKITDDFINDSSDDFPDFTDVANRRRRNTPPAEDGEDIEDDEDEIPTSRRRTQTRSRVFVKDEDDEDDDDDAPVSARKRRPSNGVGSGSKELSKQEREDLEEDLQFLSSPGRLRQTPASKLRSSAATPKSSARAKALELLKRRRAGETTEDPEVEDDQHARSGRALYDTDSGQDDAQDVDDDPDELEEPEEPSGPAPLLRSSAAHDMFLEDEYDQDFIAEEDDNDTLGVPAQLPVQFSNISRMKSKDLFKYAVEWMVQKKINPAFASDDEVYDLTFRKLDDEVKGLAGSKFTSSAWTEKFTRALQARPAISITEIAGVSRSLLEHHCDACNRSNHPATFDIQFHGRPYRGSTLEEMSDDGSDGDDGNAQEYDSKGRVVPAEDVVFHVGRNCMQNAHWAHTLEHWRFHLNEWVIDYLRQEGYTSPDKIVERDSWSTKKRGKYAEQVVDEMEEAGEIKRLYQDFRSEVNTAREASTENRRYR